MKVRTHYDNLKVTRDAPIEVIHSAYKQLALKYHPDRYSDKSEALRIMTIINRSYGVLNDPEQRAEHDRWIAAREGAIGKPTATDIPLPRETEGSGRQPGWAENIGESHSSNSHKPASNYYFIYATYHDYYHSKPALGKYTDKELQAMVKDGAITSRHYVCLHLGNRPLCRADKVYFLKDIFLEKKSTISESSVISRWIYGRQLQMPNAVILAIIALLILIVLAIYDI